MTTSKKGCLLGIDIGTTSLKATVFDASLTPKKSITRDYTLDVHGDFVEFDALEYVRMTKEAIGELSAEFDICALSVDTQCETLIVTDDDANPLTKAIVWLDNRALSQAEEIAAHFPLKTVFEVTGQCEVTPTWPASKLLWLKQNEPDIFNKIKKIFLLEDYVLYHLTGKFVTEETLQSSSLYYDIKNHIWWDEMLSFIGVSKEQLPEVVPSGKPVGNYDGILVGTGAMDQVAGAIGAGVIRPGIVSEMTGTTMAIFAATDKMPVFTEGSKVPCHLNYDGGYALLSWTPTAGIALKWFKNNFCESFDFKELDDLASKVPAGSSGLTFLPYLCGMTMPRYLPDARGVFCGISMEHTRAHFVRSILESVACMLKDSLESMGVDASEICSMGGGAKSPLWCQIKADMTGKTLVTLKNDETACLGSAILAGVAAGMFNSVEEACKMAVSKNKVYSPSGDDYTECYQNYLDADKKLFGN